MFVDQLPLSWVVCMGGEASYRSGDDEKAALNQHLLADETDGPVEMSPDSKSRATGAEPLDSAELKTEHILIVDDDPISIELLDNILSPYYEVTSADDGDVALEKLKAGHFSLLISDMLMPRMSGFELLAAMRDDPDLSKITTIIVTVDGNTENEIRALSLGAVDVMHKPYVPEIMLRRVRNLLGMRRAIVMVEQNKAYERKLEQQSQMLWAMEHDELTGLPNDRTFFRMVGKKLKAHPKDEYLLLRWDIDDYSIFNDIFGIEAGDRLLRIVGRRMLEYGADNDVVVGRVNADHFALLLPKDGMEPEEILEIIQGWLSDDENNMRVRCRMGVYVVKEHTLDPAIMCDRALYALRSTKMSFNERVAYYDDTMRMHMLQTQSLAEEMLPALENKEFKVYYQPQYNYADGSLVGAEALVRWDHPTRGFLMPGAFMGVFEHNGLISQLDNYVWEAVCQQIQTWIQIYGDEISPVSVNVSRADMYDDALCEKLCNLTKKYDVPAEKLRLEITESAYMKDPEKLKDIVSEFMQAGFVVEMDDFGSAYSSLNMLKDIPVDILKLDLKFLSDTQNQDRSGIILSSIVRMARWLHLPIIAEGVETQRQAEYLKSIGCLFMQGYFFSKALPEVEYEQILAAATMGSIDKFANVDTSTAEGLWDASAQTALLFNSFVGGAIMLERTGDKLEVLRANDRFFKILGTTREGYRSLMTDTWARIAPESRADYEAMLDYALKTHDEGHCVIKSLDLDGSGEIWTDNRCKLLSQSIDSELFYVSVANVTSEIKAENDLLRQKTMLYDLYNNVPCGIVDYVHDNAGWHILNLNETAWRLLGAASYDELLTTQKDTFCLDFVHPDYKDELEHDVNEAYKEGRPTRTECRMARLDGSYIWLEIHLRRAIMEDGTIALQSVFIDIDDRKESVINEYAHALFAAFEDVFLLDFANDTYRVLVSDSVYVDDPETRQGLRRVLEDWFAEVVLPKDRKAVASFWKLDNLRAACGGDIPPRIEYKSQLRTGDIGYLRNTAFQLDENAFFCCASNVTDGHNARELEKQNAILQATAESQERYRIIVEQTGVTVTEWNHQTGDFYHSPGYEHYAVSNYRPEEISSLRDELPFVHPEDRDAFRRFIDDSDKAASHAQTVLRMAMKDGSFQRTRISGDFVTDPEGHRTRTINTLANVDGEM